MYDFSKKRGLGFFKIRVIVKAAGEGKVCLSCLSSFLINNVLTGFFFKKASQSAIEYISRERSGERVVCEIV